MKIPSGLKKILENYGITEDDIIYAASGDFDEDFQYADSIVALTKEKLIYARYPRGNGREYRMGGYSPWLFDEKLDADMIAVEPAVVFYDLKDVDDIEVIREISAGLLNVTIKGEEKFLCMFSNTRMESFRKFERLLPKVKNGEEITERDMHVKHGKECCPKCGMIYPDQERKICPKCMDKRSLLLRVVSYFKPYKLRLALMMFCYLATAGLALCWPYLSGTVLYDRILAKDESFLAQFGIPEGRFVLALGFLVIAMLVVKLLDRILAIIQGCCTASIAPEVMARIKGQVFDSMARLSISFFTKRQTGGLMTRVVNDADEISGFFIDGVPYFFIHLGTMIATIVIMFTLNPILALCTIVFMPILFIMSYKLIPYLWHYYGKRHRATRRLNSQMNENLTGARVVKAFGQEEQEKGRFAKNNGRVRTAELDVAKYDRGFYALYYSVESVISFLVWAVGGALIISKGNLEVGLLITFSGYVGQLQGPLDFMSRMVRWYTSCMNSAQRLFEIIDAVPEVREATNPVRPERFRGEIELKNVTFGYEPNKPVLKDISFHIEAGEVFGIVGRSGAGKSTLVNLISRLYDPDEGEVLVDGINVKEYGFAELRKNVAMVSQETYIFMGTVAENIAYARPDATRAQIIDAAIRANAHDFICRMPEGYDTIIGASKRALSGGEKQRLSIARAILADPKILILDEATSAVDTETELAIQESLEQLEKGRTVLSIAHRLSTLRNASHLLVIDEGRLTESGTHEELLAQKGTFYRLQQLQSKALAMRGIE